MTIGQEFTFTRDLDGICRINKGDKGIYLGYSQARIVTGPSAGWLVTLTINAPIATSYPLGADYQREAHKEYTGLLMQI